MAAELEKTAHRYAAGDMEVPVEPAHWRSGVIDMTRLLPRLPALSFCFGDEY